MNSIRKKILILPMIVLFAMTVIWGLLVFYNQKTQAQFNEVLQRYLKMNEASGLSQRAVSDLNDYWLRPDNVRRAELEASLERLRSAKNSLTDLMNSENAFTLTNYMNLMESLAETAARSAAYYDIRNEEEAAAYFAEATRISKYISEMTLTLIGKELDAYDDFYRGIMEQSQTIKQLSFWILGLVMLVLLLLVYWFSSGITRPILQLTLAARELSHGRFDRPIRIETRDEIAFLARTFDRMRQNINTLISEIQQKAQLESELQASRLMLRESQLRSLQSQINPHFLFNTLDTLSKKAFLEGAEETSDLIANVAGLLRYNLKQLDRSVTLRDEIDVLIQYMVVQKTRFTDRLQFRMDIDERFLDLRMPCLTLQPLIENAVIHAVEPMKDGGTIDFRVKDGHTRVLIEIEDNGIGMSREKIERILADQDPSPAESHSTGIGMSNVAKRLRLYYGKEDVMDIVSKEGHGTKITLRLPLADKATDKATGEGNKHVP